MLQHISWSDYFKWVMIGLAVYYTIVLLLFFRKDIAGLVKRGGSDDEQEELLTIREDISAEEAEELLPQVNLLAAELRDLFAGNYVKEELLLAIQRKLKEYPEVKGTAFEVAVNNIIMQESEQCSMPFSAIDVRRVWA